MTLARTSAQAAASGFAWSTFSQVCRLGTQIVGLVILARLLPAADFGLLAMASVVTGFASLFRDFGTAAALIQARDLSPSLLDSVFWFNIILGISIALIVVLVAPVVAMFFFEPRLTGVLWWLALTFPVSSASLVQQALMERSSDFKPVGIIEAAAASSGLFSAIVCAVAGLGVYSLVAQSLVSACVGSVCMWGKSRWRPGRHGCTSEIRRIAGLSGNLVGFNIFNYFARNSDNMIIGHVLGTVELGYYTMAYRLMLWPLQNISSVVTRALLPVFSRMQTEPERLGAAYLRASTAITFVCAPLMLGLLVLREPFVSVALGSRWMPVAELLTWLAPVGLLQSMISPLGSVYIATGRTDLFFRWGLLAGSITVFSFAVGIQWGLRGLVIAYTVSTVVLFVPSFLIPMRLLRMRLILLLRSLLRPVLVASIMALLLQTLKDIWFGAAADKPTSLVTLIIAGALSYGGLSLFLQRSILRDIANTFWNRGHT